MDKKFEMNSFSLEGKTIVITGACGILGKYFVEGLIKANARVALIDVVDEVTSLANDLSLRSKNKIKGYRTDITDEKAVNQTIKNINDDFGEINILHNNAASKGKSLDEFFKPFEDYNLDTWREIMKVNIDAMFLMAKACGKIMVEQKKGGSIIQTSSIYGVVAPDQRIYEGSSYNGRPISTPAVYSASKAAVIGLTQYLASYWGDKNIRVNTLTPGGINSGQNETFVNKYSSRIPLNRMGEATDLVGALIFLASDASKYITGQNIIIDGGLTCW